MTANKSMRKIPLFLKIGFGVILATFLAYALYINPSTSTTQSKLQEMQKEAASLLKNGGQVVYEEDLAKYGVASLLRGISFASLSDEAYKKDLNDLVFDGWVDKGGDVFCKNGILLRFDRQAIIFHGDPVMKLDMDYSARSIHYCGG
jgi:hypothetical protein